MTVSKIKAILDSDLTAVWETVTSLEKYGWRSDLSEIKILNDKCFIEYTKSGYSTTFMITECTPYTRWELDIDNSNMSGHWTGVFIQKGRQTEIEFTEKVKAKKFFMKPFIKGFLKRQQKQYISDLKKALLHIRVHTV